MKRGLPHSEMNRDHKAILELLEEKGRVGATTTEMQQAGFNGYRGRISELRLNFDPPVDIKCLYDGVTADGRKCHRYYLPQYAPVSQSEKRRRDHMDIKPHPKPRVAPDTHSTNHPDTQSVVPAKSVLCLSCLGRFVTGQVFQGTCSKCGRSGKVTVG